MTIAVDLGRKATKQTKPNHNVGNTYRHLGRYNTDDKVKHERGHHNVGNTYRHLGRYNTDDTVKHEKGITMLGILSVTSVAISQMIQ